MWVCTWKGNKHAQKPIVIPISIWSFQIFCMFWSWFQICFGSETCPNVVNLKVSEKSWFTVYQGSFSRVWLSMFQKSEAWLISNFIVFWGEWKKERNAELESWLHALKLTHTLQLIPLGRASRHLNASWLPQLNTKFLRTEPLTFQNH